MPAVLLSFVLGGTVGFQLSGIYFILISRYRKAVLNGDEVDPQYSWPLSYLDSPAGFLATWALME